MIFNLSLYNREFCYYYYRARYYDPLTGRFTSTDPIGLAGGDVNLYAYTWNDLIGYTDPLGLIGEGFFYHMGSPFRTFGNVILNSPRMGDEAVDWWKNRWDNSCGLAAAPYFVGGFFASMWTSDTWMYTAGLLGGGVLAEVSGLTVMGPWIGSIQYHAAHAGGPHQYAHIQFLIRVGEHVTKSLRIRLPWK
jgi:RHS repeat-associated protein